MNDRPASGFTPIHPNPYIVGNPIRGRAMFFGREAEFELVRRRFEHSVRGGLMVFCGERRSGKTSILFQILDGRLGPDFIPVLIDMQSMAVANEIEFLLRISEEIRVALGPESEKIPLPTFTESSSHSASFQRYVRDVLKSHPDKKLILLFDEYELFEHKIDTGLLSADVLHILANLIEHHPVFVVFTGSQHLEQRRKEYWKILGKSLHKMISFLEREDAVSLIRKPVEDRVRYPDRTVESICRLTAGQAFYTQAICQSLVDQLNERHTGIVTPETLASVVDGIINNPLPQMIFQWDALERNEKLVLALLAECLADDHGNAGVEDLLRHLRRRQYPLELDKAHVATTLEKLFKTEMLLRDDRAAAHAYAFRMDLWRLWIRRQHSVWQVMREEGLEIRRRFGGLRPAAFGIALVVLIAVPSLVINMTRRRAESPRSPGEGVLGAMASLGLEADPAHATILLDGRAAGSGLFQGMLAADRDHRFRLTATGYADTEIVLKMAAGDSLKRRVVLRELLGDLRIDTRPPGAEVVVDGRKAGRSPVTVPGLTAAKPHRIEATLAGFGAAQREVSAQGNVLTPVLLVLGPSTTEVALSSEPAAEIRMDGNTLGRSPLSLKTIRPGSHTFTAQAAGYLKAETTVVVRPEGQRIHIVLLAEAPGSLVVLGDQPGEIWIDGVLVVANVQNSGPRTLAPGNHQVRVIFADGAAREQSVLVRSGERSVYDYTKATVTRRPQEP